MLLVSIPTVNLLVSNDVLFWNSYKITFSPGVDQWMACKAPICWVQWFLLHWIKNWGIRPGCGSRQSRDLPVDGKKLVIRWPIKKNNTRTGAKKKTRIFCEEVTVHTALNVYLWHLRLIVQSQLSISTWMAC